nr:hypothetical protein [Candidatus Freyarchaeota archaeon]
MSTCRQVVVARKCSVVPCSVKPDGDLLNRQSKPGTDRIQACAKLVTIVEMVWLEKLQVAYEAGIPQ